LPTNTQHVETHSYYHMVMAELPFVHKVIDCMHQTGYSKGA